MYAIYYPKTERYYIGESFSRLYNDDAPTFGDEGDTSKAVRWYTEEDAKAFLRSKILDCLFAGCEVTKVD